MINGATRIQFSRTDPCYALAPGHVKGVHPASRMYADITHELSIVGGSPDDLLNIATTIVTISKQSATESRFKKLLSATHRLIRLAGILVTPKSLADRLRALSIDNARRDRRLYLSELRLVLVDYGYITSLGESSIEVLLTNKFSNLLQYGEKMIISWAEFSYEHSDMAIKRIKEAFAFSHKENSIHVFLSEEDYSKSIGEVYQEGLQSENGFVVPMNLNQIERALGMALR